MSNDQGMKPRLLLVEDDAVSRSFMTAALEALPAQVDLADTMATALAMEGCHQLWLLDANLADGSGIDLLGKLRARFPGIPALAHTADHSPALHAQLLATGFDDVLTKPLTAAQLQQAVARLLHASSGQSLQLRVQEGGRAFLVLPLWDQATALAALNGNQEHVATLRGMFLDELGRQHEQILSALHSANFEGARHVLHQLKASSGFVGALRLNAAAAALEKSLADAAALERFSRTVHDTQTAGNP